MGFLDRSRKRGDPTDAETADAMRGLAEAFVKGWRRKASRSGESQPRLHDWTTPSTPSLRVIPLPTTAAALTAQAE